jgi:hypothetical protein
MSDPAPQPELLHSLGKLVRGLNAVFWALPLAMVFITQEYLSLLSRSLGVLLPLIATSLLLYGLSLMGSFQKQERIWIAALDRAKFAALALVGLSPFIFWRNQFPAELYFIAAAGAFFGIGLIFLYSLNVVLLRLTAMLPDETLRGDARTFTAINRGVLVALFAFSAFLWVASELESPPDLVRDALMIVEIDRQWLFTASVLFPVAVTMTLLWKVKEAVLASVFGGSHT